jgi:hypothetical protein
MGIAAASILSVTLAACSGASAGSGSGGPGNAAAAGGQSHEEVVAVVRELVACFRQHGEPDFPDGTVDDHNIVHFPDSAPRVPDSTARACRSIFDRLPPQPTASPPVPHAVFEQWLAFARCMRAHGIHDWPDPNPDGSFPLPPDIIARGKALTLPAQQACDSLNPDPQKRINAERAAG